MKNSHNNSLQKILNQREESLVKKHQRRLDEMLSNALEQTTVQSTSNFTQEAHLEKKAQKLADKYQTRLDDMTKQALLSQKLNQHLNEKEESLKNKKQQQLQKITRWVMKNKSHPTSLFKWMLTSVPTMALVSLFTISITVTILNSDNNEQLTPYSLQANAKLPVWVKDTNVPLELLENLDFYVWLSQQNQFTQTEEKFIVATALYNQYCISERCAPRNVTKGISRTTTRIGEL